MGFTIADLPQVFNAPEFKTATPDERELVLNGVLEESFRAMSETPEFSQEHYKQFGDIAAAARDKLNSMQTTGETAKQYAGVAWEGAKGVASALGGLAADASVVDEQGNARIPFSSVAGIVDTNIDKASETLSKWGAGWNNPANLKLKDELGTLKVEIDKGYIPLNSKDKLDEWLSNRAGSIADAQEKFYAAAGDVSEDDHRKAFAASNSIIAPRNAALLSQYISTRNPKTWDALENSIRETPMRAQLNAQENKIVEDSPVFKVLKGFEDLHGSSLPEGFAEQTVKGSGDPINIAATVLPMLRGVKLAGVAATGGKALARRELGSLFKGATEAVALGEIGLDIQNPDASFEEHLQTGKNMIAMSLGMHVAGRLAKPTVTAAKAVGAKAKAAYDWWVDDANPTPAQNGNGAGATAAQNGPQPGAPNSAPNGPQPQPSSGGSGGTFDADAAVDEVFGAGTAAKAKAQQQTQQQAPPQQPGPQQQAPPQQGAGPQRASGSAPDPQAAKRRADAEAARKKAEEDWWRQRQADYDRRKQQQSQQSQQSQQRSNASQAPDPTKAKTFGSQDDFNSFMDNAAKNGDVEQGHEAWKLNQKFFQQWFKQTAKSTDDGLHDFRTSVLNSRTNAQHTEYAAEQRKAREQQPQPATDQQGGGTPAGTGESQGVPTGRSGDAQPVGQEPSGVAPAEQSAQPAAQEPAQSPAPVAVAAQEPAPTPAQNAAAIAADQAIKTGDTGAANVLAAVADIKAQTKPSTPPKFGTSAPAKSVAPLPVKHIEGYTGKGLTASMVESPVLNFINVNPIHLPPTNTTEGKSSESRRWRENVGGYWHKFLFSPDTKAQRVDQVAQAAYDNTDMNGNHAPLISAPTADALMEAVQKEINARGSMRSAIARNKRAESTKQKQFMKFDAAAQSGDTQVMANNVDLGGEETRGLMKGDELTIKGEKFEVIRTEEDEQGNVLSATLKDGPTYGVQEIGSDYVMLVDEFKPRETPKSSGEFVPEGELEQPQQQPAPKPFSGDQLLDSESKTAEQIAAEKAAEAAKLQKMQDAQDVRVGAAKPLRAADDVLPEADMFDPSKGPQDLFAQPKPEAKPAQAAPQPSQSTRASQTGKNPLLTAKEQGLPTPAQAGHKAAIGEAITLREPFHAAEALRYGYKLPQGFTVDDAGIARFSGTVEGIPSPEPEAIKPADTDTPEVARLKEGIARASDDLALAQEDNDEAGAAAIQRSLQTMQQRLKGLQSKPEKAPLRELHEFTRDEAKAQGRLKEHRNAVKEALQSGQTVPDEVIADYGDTAWGAKEIERRVQSAEPVDRQKPHDSVEETLQRAIDASEKRAKARRGKLYSNPFAGLADDVWRDALKTALFVYRTTKSAAKAAKAAFDHIKSKVPSFRFTEADVQAQLDKMHFGTGNTPVMDIIRGEWNDAVANLKAGFTAMKAKDMLAAAVDGADNAPSIVALQAANNIRLKFGENPRLAPTDRVNVEAKLNEEGASFVTEAYRHVRSKKQAIADQAFNAAMDRWAKTPGAALPVKQVVTVQPAEARYALEQQGKRIENSQTAGDARRYSPIIEHALQNFDELDQLRQYAHMFTDAQLALENSHGFDTKYTHDYIRRVYENIHAKRGWTEPDMMFEGGDGGTGGKTFMKGRVFDSVFDAMDAGYIPASMNIADLTESRIAAGQTMIEHKQLRDVLFGQKDETTQEPIIMEHSPGKPVNVNYKVVNMAGVEVQAHKRYAGLLKDLYQPSVIRNRTIGRAAMKVNMTVKHMGLMVDTYHAGRVAFKQLAATGRMGYGRALSLLEYMPSDLAHLESIGHITPEEHQWALGKLGLTKELVHAGLNLNRLMDAIDREALSLIGKVLEGIPVLGKLAKATDAFNHWVFQKMTRGAMLEVALNFYDHNIKKMPHGEALRLAAKEVNEMFGNLGRQGFAKSKTMQDILRIGFLAPQWSEGTARSEMRGAAQTAQAAYKFVTSGKVEVGNSARVMMTTIIAVLLGGQLLNYVFKGHSTLDNEEGHQADIFIPGGKHGFYLSPFTFTNQYMEQFHRYYVDKGGLAPNVGSKVSASLDAIAQILSNKLHPVARAGQTVVTGHDYFGRPLPGFDRLVEAGKTMAFLPIPLNPILKSNPGEMPSITFEGNKPGAWQKQLFASTGVHIMSGEGPVQKMYALARPFRADDMARIPTEGKYTAMRKDIADGYIGYAWERMKDLVASGDATIANMDESFGWTINADGEATFHHRMFTGSKTAEVRFLKTLTPEQQQWHADALAEQKQNAQAYKALRREHITELRELEKAAKAKKKAAQESAP